MAKIIYPSGTPIPLPLTLPTFSEPSLVPGCLGQSDVPKFLKWGHQHDLGITVDSRLVRGPNVYFHMLLDLDAWVEARSCDLRPTPLPATLLFVFLVLGTQTPGNWRILSSCPPSLPPGDRRAAAGPAGPVWAGLGPPLLPWQLLPLTCILSGGLWWGYDDLSLALAAMLPGCPLPPQWGPGPPLTPQFCSPRQDSPRGAESKFGK